MLLFASMPLSAMLAAAAMSAPSLFVLVGHAA